MAGTIKRIVGPGLITDSAVTKYTVSAGQRIVIVAIHVNNTSGAAATFTMSIGANAAGTQLFTAKQIAANDVYDGFGRYELVAGEIIQALSGTTNVLNLTIDAEVHIA